MWRKTENDPMKVRWSIVTTRKLESHESRLHCTVFINCGFIGTVWEWEVIHSNNFTAIQSSLTTEQPNSSCVQPVRNPTAPLFMFKESLLLSRMRFHYTSPWPDANLPGVWHLIPKAFIYFCIYFFPPIMEESINALRHSHLEYTSVCHKTAVHRGSDKITCRPLEK